MGLNNIANKTNFENYLNNLGNKMTIIMFTASWCNPCKRIKPTCLLGFEQIKNENKKIDIYTIDVDDQMELFGWLKTKRMVAGIPAILAYFGDVKRDVWYIPDDSVSGGDIKEVNDFFDRCMKKAADYE